MYYDRFKDLCTKNAEKPTPLLKKLGLSGGNIKKWQEGATVNSDILCRMADYFNVSVDYLLGRTDKPETGLDTGRFLGCDSDYNGADIVLFGAPYDGTTSNRPGARFAGKAVRAESFGIETYSPYQDRDMAGISVYDGGELDLPFGDPKPVLDKIYRYVKSVTADKKLPVMIGGEHLVTLGAFKAVYDLAKERGVYMRDAAYMIAIDRVNKAVKQRGWI